MILARSGHQDVDIWRHSGSSAASSRARWLTASATVARNPLYPHGWEALEVAIQGEVAECVDAAPDPVRSVGSGWYVPVPPVPWLWLTGHRRYSAWFSLFQPCAIDNAYLCIEAVFVKMARSLARW